MPAATKSIQQSRKKKDIFCLPWNFGKFSQGGKQIWYSWHIWSVYRLLIGKLVNWQIISCMTVFSHYWYFSYEFLLIKGHSYSQAGDLLLFNGKNWFVGILLTKLNFKWLLTESRRRVSQPEIYFEVLWWEMTGPIAGNLDVYTHTHLFVFLHWYSVLCWA